MAAGGGALSFPPDGEEGSGEDLLGRSLQAAAAAGSATAHPLRGPTLRGLSRATAIWLPVTIAMLVVGSAYYPGVMRLDSLVQYRQAITGHYTDWHPPVMAWLWGLLDGEGAGPLPMLLLHLLLYGAGIGLVAEGLHRSGRAPAAALVLLAGLAPIPLGYLGVIMKDTTLAVSLVAATGLVARFRLVGQAMPASAKLLVGLLLALAMSLRFNAPLAAISLLFGLLLNARPWSLPRRLALAGLALGLGLLLVPIAQNAVFRPERSDVHLSPVLYDLSGMSFHSGRNLVPDLGLADAEATSPERCYTPIWWDTYAWGACAVVFERFRAAVHEGRFNPYRSWLAAVAAEPLSYLRHRLAHANSNLRFLLPYGTADVTFIETEPNEFGFDFVPNALTLAIREAGLFQAATPAGWPVTWVALSIGCLILAPGLRPGPARSLFVALAASSVTYGASYLVFSVASDLRYHLWTMIAAALAVAIAAGELFQAGRFPRRRAALALLPAVLVAGAGMAWRVFDLAPL